MRISLRGRIMGGLATIALTLLVVSAVSIASLTRLGSSIATILRENYASVIACEDMNEALERQDAAAQLSVGGHREQARDALRASRAEFDRAFEAESRNITVPGEGDAVARIATMYREYVRAVDSAIASSDQTDLNLRERVPPFSALQSEIHHVLRLNQTNMQLADRRAKMLARNSVWIAIAVSAAAMLIAIWFSWRLPSLVVQPLEHLTRIAKAIGEGDLQRPVDVPRVHEIEPLAEAFQKMLEKLRAYRESSLGELLAAKDLAHATIECLVDPVVVFGRDGDILLTNEAAERSFGLRAGSEEELRASEVEIPAEFASARDLVFSSGEAVSPRNFGESMRRDGRDGERYFLVRSAPLRAEGGEKSRAIIVAQDVTRFRRIDDLKSDMVATVSHEFKTPLTSLRMATHLLLEPHSGSLTEAQRELVTTARDETERLRTMVDELLDLVRIEAEAGMLHRAAIIPADLLESVIDAHRTLAREKDIRLTLEPSDTNETAVVDHDKLAIVLANLVSNAIRHTPSGGEVSLAASSDGGMLRISVRDTGEGIASDDILRIFERAPVVRHGPAGQNQHGLGLTIAREIVLQHGGELTAHSERGNGSTFVVVIPSA